MEVEERLKWELNQDQSGSRQSDGGGSVHRPWRLYIMGPKCHVIYGIRSPNLLLVFPSLYCPHQFDLYILAESFVVHLLFMLWRIYHGHYWLWWLQWPISCCNCQHLAQVAPPPAQAGWTQELYGHQWDHYQSNLISGIPWFCFIDCNIHAQAHYVDTSDHLHKLYKSPTEYKSRFMLFCFNGHEPYPPVELDHHLTRFEVEN